jgi:hypothetical protein
MHMTGQTMTQTWATDSRLTPWVIFDLERTAWVVELRASELTDDERRIVRNVARRFLAATDDSNAFPNDR